MPDAAAHHNGLRVRFNGRSRFFRELFDSVQAGLILIDPQSHRIVDINPAAAALIDDRPENIIGSICHRFICPAEQGQCPITDLHQAFDRAERVLVTRDGKKIPVIKSVGYIEIGGERFLLENLTDNSQVKKSEAAVRESERKIRAIFDQTYQFIGIMTPEGVLIEANRSAVKFSGIEERDVIGKFFWDTPWWTHSAELQDQLRDAVKRAAQGEFIRFEATHKAPDGSLHYIDFSLKPVMDELGSVVYLIPEGRDITDRKKIEDELNRKNEELYAAYEQLTATEEELRQNYEELAQRESRLIESENIYRAIFGNTGTAMALIEENTVLSLVNAEFEKLTGYSKEEVEGKMTWTQYVLPEDLERMLAQHKLRRTDPSSALSHYEFRVKTKDGRTRDIYLTIDMIPGTKKSVASLLDVTENKRMTRELKESLLEKEVLLREIHHRVKNNLQIIISLLNLQCRNIPDTKVLNAVQECQNRIRAMVLVHEKIYQSERISEIDMRDYTRFLVRYLFEFYQVDSNAITFDLEGTPVKVSLSIAVPLSLIINEIVSNSIKHAFPGSRQGRIRISTQSDNGRIVITAGDDGGGIPDSVDPETSGTLGLMLINNLCRQIHADLALERTGGTRYTITFPAPVQQ
ncbi:MAG: PAS domain S-box protein [Methanomicrobiales archaeon]|nr:PAS domain S-box protein [Methanomicrobiales archaeon]